jgi:hypothetical protein
MKLKTPVTIKITESENLALLWHVLNQAELIVQGRYNLNNISAKALTQLGYLAHSSDNVTEMWRTINDAVTRQGIDENTGNKKFVPVEVKLNDEYTAQVTATEVIVGCQTISHEAVRALCDAVNKAGA